MEILEQTNSCINADKLYNQLEGEDIVEAFRLEIDVEEMVVKLIACPPLPESLRDVETVRNELRENNVFKGIDFSIVDNAFRELDDAEEGKEYIIARGKSAEHGENGYVEFEVNVSGKPIYDTTNIEDDEAVDYKNAIRIESVKPGQILARIIPPTDGVPGFSLAGKELPCRKGKPAVYRLGEGTALDPDGIVVRAIQEGRPVYAHKVISVNPIYEVPSDVCYETGNIKFDGYVHVHGNVQDDFVIEAKNIEINGVVGAATLLCSNNLIIHGGINGKSKAEIKCNGSAEIKYVNTARLEVRGDLNVAREIVNSTVWSRGKVTAGKIIGGETIGLLGVDVKVVGSDMGVPTIVEPGGNYEVRRIEQAMDVLGGQLNKLLSPLKGIMGDNKKFLQFPVDKQEELRKSYDYFLRLKAAHDKLTSVRRKLLSDQSLKPVAQVILFKLLYPDVTIRTSKCVRQFRTQVQGPAALMEDIASGTIRIAGYNVSRGKVIEEKESGTEGGGSNG